MAGGGGANPNGVTGTRQALYFAAIIFTAALAAEFTARITDYFFDHIPFLANPSEDLASPRSDNQLQVRDEYGVHGRPFGRFKKWQLNNYGFRGPDISLASSPGCVRVMVLGASESFGYYERAGMEYPAQLARRLKSHGCYEVINAALVGMELSSMRRYWEHWAGRFTPDVVVIYPTPHFYLNESVTRRKVNEPTPVNPQALALPSWDSRFLSRLRQVVDLPDFVQRWRNAKSIAAQTAGKDSTWYFTAPPTDRLKMFEVELTTLTRAIQASGSRPIMMTHAFRVRFPLESEDYSYLEAHRVFMPRALPDAIVQFEAAANDVIRRVAKRHAWPMIDLAATLGGQREYFVDLVHFTDDGAGVVADAIARQIVTATSQIAVRR